MLIYANCAIIPWWWNSLGCKEPLNGIQSNLPARSSGFQAENCSQFLSFPVENIHSNPFQLQPCFQVMPPQLADPNHPAMPQRTQQTKATLTSPSKASFVKKKPTKKGQLIHHDGLALKFISISIFLLAAWADFDMTHIEWIIQDAGTRQDIS